MIDAKMRVGVLAALLHIPFGILFPLMPSANWVLIMLCPAAFTIAMPMGVAAAAIQQIMPNRMRAQGSAIYLFVINLIGLGIGPTAVALCTDYVFQDPNKVNLSLLLVSTVFGVLSVFLLTRGCRHFKSSVEYIEQYNARQHAN